MGTRNVVFPEPLEQAIESLISTGRYQNASEVIRAGLRLLLQAEAEQAARLEVLRNATLETIAGLEQGHVDQVELQSLQQLLEQHLDNANGPKGESLEG